MGWTNNCLFPYKSQPLVIIFLLFLLISSLTHYSFMAEGRPISKLIEAARTEVIRSEENVKEMVMMRSLIGSRPPRCERRCSNCGHCEAVQVPVVGQLESQRVRSSEDIITYGAPKTIAYSRGDHISNYKPMCWKCKCGDFIFNP